MRPVINLKALNFWVRPQHFNAMRDCSTEQLAGKIILKGCVFHGPNQSGTLEVHSICGGPSPVSVYVSPVRSVLLTFGIHQGSKTGCYS